MTDVFVVHRSELLRRGLGELIDGTEDLRVAGEASDAAEAFDAIDAVRPRVVVIDVGCGQEAGLELCLTATESGIGAHCLVLADDSGRDRLFDAIDAGAAGFLLDRASGPAVLDAIRVVADGRSVLDPTLADRVFARLRTLDKPTRIRTPTLTPQERRVLKHVSEGLTNRQIARQCGISEKTVKNHVTSIFRKLDISSRTQAALYSRRSA